MKVLLGQAVPAPGDPHANVAAIAAALADAPGADVAILPELYLSGYDLAAAAERAIAPDHPALGELAGLARTHRTAIVAGFAERLAGGRPANSVACIDADGAWTATYRKTHLFGRERDVFAAGDELVVVQLAGHRVGVSICFDVEFPGPSRALARAGAEVLVTVAANMEPYGPDHRLAACARALDNRLPHAYVNRAGEEGGFRFVGESLVAAPDGRPMLELGSASDAALAEIEVGERPAAELDYLRLERPDLPVKVITHDLEGAAR